MGDLLQRLLNEVVVTPYDPDITSRLTTVCDTMADDVTVDNIDRYIVSFVFNKPDWEVKKEVEEKYAEMYADEEALVLPPLFAIVLSQYITIVAISTKLEGMDQATASLILMNYMLYRKGTLTRLILPGHIAEMYYKLDHYIQSQDKIDASGDQQHLKELLAQPNYLAEHYDDEEVKCEVREIAKMAVLYKRQFIISEYKTKNRTNTFVKVYEYLSDVVEESKWLFMENDVKQILQEIVSEEEQKKQATIEGIVNELIKAKVSLPYERIEESSLLLRYVNRDEAIPDEIKSKRLTVMEFGVYVYYELLLEHIIDEYYGSRDSE